MDRILQPTFIHKNFNDRRQVFIAWRGGRPAGIYRDLRAPADFFERVARLNMTSYSYWYTVRVHRYAHEPDVRIRQSVCTTTRQ